MLQLEKQSQTTARKHHFALSRPWSSAADADADAVMSFTGMQMNQLPSRRGEKLIHREIKESSCFLNVSWTQKKLQVSFTVLFSVLSTNTEEEPANLF